MMDPLNHELPIFGHKNVLKKAVALPNSLTIQEWLAVENKKSGLTLAEVVIQTMPDLDLPRG